MTQQHARIISNDELAALVKLMRDARKWTQEQLAEITGLNIRTIQRVENGASASFDTRRALAIAFESNDIDCLNKAHVFLTQEEIEETVNKIEKDYLTLDAKKLNNGRLVGELAEWSRCDMTSCDYELPLNIQQIYAEFLDYFRDFRDCVELYNQVDKLRIYNDFNVLLETIELDGFCVKYAKRTVSLKLNQNEGGIIPMNLVYISIFPEKQVPNQFLVSREIDFNW